MQGYFYWVNASVTTSTSVLDLLRISAPSDAAVVIHQASIEQSSETDSEPLALKVHRGSTDGSGGSSATVSPTNVGTAAFGGTAVAGNSTQSTEGAVVLLGGVNVLNPGWYFQPPPEGRITLSPSGRIVFELETAPADAITFKINVLIEEIGG